MFLRWDKRLTLRSTGAFFAATTAIAVIVPDASGTTQDPYPAPPQSTTQSGRYAEISTSGPAYRTRSALGETPGAGPDISSRAFIYVEGSGLHADSAQVGWRGDYFAGESNVCGGNFDIQWTDAQGQHQDRNMGVDNCTTLPQRNWPGHYVTFDLHNETFSPNTDVCGRYHLDFGDSPWVCITMKP